MKKCISLLGSTGSIGTQSLRVCRMQGYEVMALTAHQNAALLEQQARAFRPRLVVAAQEEAYRTLKTALADTPIRVEQGMEGILHAATLPGCTVVNALLGVAGLLPTLEALAAGNPVALANKETLVAGGKLVTSLAREKKLPLTPIDSEHSAIFQCLQGNTTKQVKRLILTASGGPFFGRSREELAQVTREQALCHPNWEMGAKITVDSSTLMNKGLEFIEAMWLFGLPPEQIDIVVHRQSIIHSMVEYLDGSVMAQLGSPDMCLPIQYALTWPQRCPSPAKPLDLLGCGPLTFEAPDRETFTCLEDCIQAAKLGGLYPCLLNGANEEAVALFLEGRIGYTGILRLVRRTLEWFRGREGYGDYHSARQVLEADREARAFVQEQLGQLG